MTQPRINFNTQTQSEIDLLKRYGLAKRKYSGYPENIKDGFQSYDEERNFRTTYFKRLTEYLPNLVRQGLLSKEEATQQYNDIRKTLLAISQDKKGNYFTYGIDEIADAGLQPYSKEISASPIEWKKMQMDFAKDAERQEVSDIKTQVTSQRNRDRFALFLNAQQAQGVITPEEKNQVLAEIERQIKLGVPTKDLPFADQADKYEGEFQQTLKTLQ